jgi:hypothetical protein
MHKFSIQDFEIFVNDKNLKSLLKYSIEHKLIDTYHSSDLTKESVDICQ